MGGRGKEGPDRQRGGGGLGQGHLPGTGRQVPAPKAPDAEAEQTANPGDPVDVRSMGIALASAHTRTLVRTTAVEVVRQIVRVGEVIPWLQRTSRTANCPAWFQVATLIAVENRCHWSLDVTYREDESRIRAQHLRENFAWLNRLSPDSLPQANLVTPGTGTGGTGFGPNVYFAGLRSSLELSTCSGVMIWPV